MAAADFPGDVGAILALLLNYVRLAPGEAIYLGAGNVHAYLRGTGIEIMANSDNVLRCGLTPKHIDVGELLKITDFSPLDEPRCAAERTGCGQSFDAPVADFALSRLELDRHGWCGVGGTGPYIVLCTSGEVRVEALDAVVDLGPGRAAFVRARDAAFSVRGSGRAFAATVGA
jgi:mannose-6-phosphate isomerase